LPQSLGNFAVNDIVTVAKIFKAMNCSSSKDQDAVGCLAGHLLAAKLNRANGSLACIDPVIAQADAFQLSINYSGPGAKYTLTPAQRSTAISLKTALDQYNNNISCP
jgi:hypothetical protein